MNMVFSYAHVVTVRQEQREDTQNQGTRTMLTRVTQMHGGRGHCQGLCDVLEDNPAVGAKKYFMKGGLHVRCSRCDKWMLQEAMKANGRCPCCNFRPRYK